MCDCIDLIGRPYRLGADGTDREIDCIHLVYEVLQRLGIPAPEFDPSWYDGNRKQIVRALKAWGRRIDYPQYDGDVLLIPQQGWAFAVTWQAGILYINRHLEQVAWCPITAIRQCHCFRSRSS